MEHIDDKKERGIYFYERCIELYDPKQAADVTEESLYIQIATLCMWDQGQVERAMEIIERYNHSGTYDNLLASCLLFAGKRKEAKKMILHHSVANQIFCYNDFTTLADLFRQEGEWEAAVEFLEAEVDCYAVYRFCEGVKGRMIDNFSSTLELLENKSLKNLYEELDT